MQQLFLETLILIFAVFGIILTVFQMLAYRTERKLYYKIIKLKNTKGKNIEIIISADDYDLDIEENIKKVFDTYNIEK